MTAPPFDPDRSVPGPAGATGAVPLPRSPLELFEDLVDQSEHLRRRLEAASWMADDSVRELLVELGQDPDPAVSAAPAPDDRDAEKSAVQTAIDRARAATRAAAVAVLQDLAAAEGDPGAQGPRRSTLRSLGRHGPALAHGIGGEVVHLLARKPRTVVRSLAFALLSGVAYLAFVRLVEWHEYERWTPFLAVLVISTIMGSSVCLNSMAFDAARVRAALDTGTRAWQLMVVKNAATAVLVLPVGVVLSVLLAWGTGRWSTLVMAVAVVLTLILLWAGVGNVLSVVLPLHQAPLREHRRQNTLRRYLVVFGVSWVIGYAVTGLLIWRVLAVHELDERWHSTVLTAALLIFSGLVTWALLTVLAALATHQPDIRRRLRLELRSVD